jgi:hypothetical protein
MEATVLIHLPQWESSRDFVELEKGITLCRTEGTETERLYKELCETRYVDDGDPFNYGAHVHFSESIGLGRIGEWSGPFSAVSQACNLIAICSASPLGMCRLILRATDHDQPWIHTEIIYDHSPGVDVLQTHPASVKSGSDGNVLAGGGRSSPLNDTVLDRIAQCWGVYTELDRIGSDADHRVQNALSYFFYSWNSYYLDHVCLNLAIVLESLFAPPSPQEVSHQIAFNVSRFYGASRSQREELYKTVKRFYSIRSQIIHGGMPEEGNLSSITPQVFRLCAGILQRIVGDRDNALRFSSAEKRKKLISEWLFGDEA